MEIFLRDRDIDYEMFVYDRGIIKYTTKEKTTENNNLYYGLNRGTIILNGKVLNNNEATSDEIQYIKDIIAFLSEEVISYKKDYEPVFVKYTTGNNASDMIMNSNVIEIPDRRKFREWSYIQAFDYLNSFVDEYEKSKNSDGLASKTIKLFKH